MAFDSIRGRTVLYGGVAANSQILSDVWEWDGTSWTFRTATGPSPTRAGSGFAFDAASGIIVLFGGSTGNGGYLNDNWSYNGSAWTSRALPSPSVRDGSPMAYDSVRGRTVLFGGNNGGVMGDTWELGCPNYCYVNCDGSTILPILNVIDFACFLNAFAIGNTYANCDHSTQPPVLNVLDFTCFLNQFAAGCP